MATHKREQATRKALLNVFNSIFPRVNRIVGAVLSALLRLLFRIGISHNSHKRRAQGFVLPTTILLLLVLSLAVGSISLRTLSRTEQTIGDRQQRVIYNAATPAIDRAKAKLEYLFTRDPRLPNGIPSEDQLFSMMVNDGEVHNGVTYPIHDFTDEGIDGKPYTFTGLDSGNEWRVDLNGDENPDNDNAWGFDVPLEGSTEDAVGKTARIIYSIIFDTPDSDDVDSNPALSLNNSKDGEDGGVKQRADKLMVRNGPLSLANLGSSCLSQATDPEGGWFSGTVDKSVLQKNFQVNAVVIPGTGEGDSFEPDATGTISTLELQQDRKIDKGNKWGAWFRNDLEIFPGPALPWNGAIYTDGNLMLGREKFKAHLISSTASCLNTTKEDSEIVVGGQTGEVVVGRMDDRKPSGRQAKFDIFENGPAVSKDRQLKDDNDSVNLAGDEPTATKQLAQELSLDPAVLLLKNKHQERGNAETFQIADWDPGESIDERIVLRRNQLANANPEEETEIRELVIDDFYRADNRAGPLPKYNTNDEEKPTLDDVGGLGATLTDDKFTKLSGTSAEDVGADGYWERRARNQGMRVIVGQRLELGNPIGWGGLDENGNLKALPPNASGFYSDAYDNSTGAPENPGFYDEPLLPWDTCHPDESPANGTPDPSTNNDNRCHEARQRRSLRDNLAAVQATAIYHADSFVTPNSDDGDFPKACLATVVHPGTVESLQRSSTYEDLTAGAMLPSSLMVQEYPLVINDFFAGKGTNGWEFQPIGTVSQDMERALWNLAYYAGDPLGGAPSFPVEQGSEDIVHPYPYMSMWGDFSMLRRILENDGVNPSSPADKTTLHTAECLLGMLAYNVDYLDKFNVGDVDPAKVTALDIDAVLDVIQDVAAGTTPPPYQGQLLSPAVIASIENILPVSPYIVTSDTPPDFFISGLEAWIEGDDSAFVALGKEPKQILAIARLFMQSKQVERDRRYGFEVNNIGINCTTPVDLSRLCTDHPKYPILYSLFPGDTNGDSAFDNSDAHGELPTGTELRTRGFNPENSSPFLPGRTDLTGLNGSVADLYKYVDIEAIATLPRPLNLWQLPKSDYTTDTADDLNPNSNQGQELLIKCVGAACGLPPDQGKLIQVGFKDAALFDGRQLLNTRTLDFQLDLLRQTKVPGTNDYWLPLSGIIYAFREDAIREDAIVRPETASASCTTSTELESNDCLMLAAQLDTADDDRDAFTSTDPSIPDIGITPKSVDHAPDPERRSYGFRLRNGDTLKRDNDDGRGMSFISDASVYILGNFNWHKEKDTNINRPDQQIQEFDKKLTYHEDGPEKGFYKNFYDRKTVNNKFASATEDDWRPAEIVSDALTILSVNFCDGSTEDVFATLDGSAIDPAADNTYRCENQTRTSYLNWPLPSEDKDWVRENVFDSSSPYVFTRNGNPLIEDGVNKDYDDNYDLFLDEDKRRNNLVDAEETTVNASFVSRITPSRQFQSYGGLHNYPRLLEDWDDKALNISGAFFQLEFSQSATGPYDQLQWEPRGTLTEEPEVNGFTRFVVIPYYEAAIRRWGYDVALRYGTAGPLASRFVSPNPARNEFYSEPEASDPYIVQLCKADLDNCPL